MAKNDVYDKPLVLKLIIGCSIAILIFTFAWFSKFKHNLDNWVFTVGFGLLLGGFILEAIKAYQFADDEARDGKRKVLIAIAVLLLCWLGGWAAGSNEKKMMEQDFEKGKVESLYSDTNHLPSKIPQ